MEDLVTSGILAPAQSATIPMTQDRIDEITLQRDYMQGCLENTQDGRFPNGADIETDEPYSEDQALMVSEQIETFDADLQAGTEVNPEYKSFMYRLNTTPQNLINYCSRMYPNFVYGEEGSTVTRLSVQSNSNSRFATIQMLRNRASEGGGTAPVDRGVPMRVMPVQASIEMMGNPFVRFMQKFFIRADTGTTIDNLYAVSGIEHKITPENFTTSLQLVALEAYGTFNAIENDLRRLQIAAEQINEVTIHNPTDGSEVGVGDTVNASPA
jgi:hypothetical protein